MKTLLYLFCLFFTVFALGCKDTQVMPAQKEKEQATLSESTQKWKLTQVVYTSMVSGQVNTPTTPPYDEILELKADSTFKRYRSTGYEATGTYLKKQNGTDEQGFLATFNDKALAYHDLPGYRQYSHTEGQVYFRQVSAEQLVESYMAADGPSFVYQKINE